MAENQEKDLCFQPLPELSWAPDDQVDSLERIAEYVSMEAQRAIKWYLEKKRSKKAFAQLCRFLAIIATAAAGLLPLFSEIYAVDGKHIVSAAWASVALVMAAALIGLDHFFGFSSAWMRFLTAEMKIRQTLHAFHMDWEIQRSTLEGQTPTDQQVRGILSQFKSFLYQVDTLLNDETTLWVEEFRAALREVDKVFVK
jgi:hypothetical protein